MRHNLLALHWLLLAFAVGGVLALSGCRAGASLARRDRSPSANQTTSDDAKGADDVRQASQREQLDNDAAIAQHDPPPKQRRLIPDWLRFGDQESVPLPTTTPIDESEAEPLTDSVDNFQ